MQGSTDGLLQVTEIIPVGIVDERNKITSQMTVSKHIKSVLILLCKDSIIRNLHNITDSANGANCHIDLQMMKFRRRKETYTSTLLYSALESNPQIFVVIWFFSRT